MGSSVKTPPPPPDFRTSKLATIGDVKLGMTPDEVKALFPATSDLELGEAVPATGEPLQISAKPKAGKTGPQKSFGFLDGGIVLYGESTKVDQPGYDAKVAELTAAYGQPAKEPPDILKKTKFYGGEEAAKPPAETTPGEPGKTPPATEKPAEPVKAPPAAEKPAEPGKTPPAAEKPVEPKFPANSVFWADPATNIVILMAMENGEQTLLAIRTDKVDAYFDKFQEVMNKMIEDAMKNMGDQKGGPGGATPPAGGGGTPPPPPPPPAGGKTGG